MTGSLITSIVNGHWKSSITIRYRDITPSTAGDAHDMLSAGAGASPGVTSTPRAVVETAVGDDPDDAFEGDKLTLSKKNDSVTEVDMMFVACLTSVYKGGVHDLTVAPSTPAVVTSVFFFLLFVTNQERPLSSSFS